MIFYQYFCNLKNLITICFLMTGSLGVNVLEETGFPKIEISAFKCQNGLELVLCNTKNPLYAVYVTIPVTTTFYSS